MVRNALRSHNANLWPGAQNSSGGGLLLSFYLPPRGIIGEGGVGEVALLSGNIKFLNRTRRFQGHGKTSSL